jgi:membrane protease YdiL (CAAX protease family)
MDGTRFQFQAITGEYAWELILSFLVGVFIIALWEEIVNRGFIQSRLQATWGIWGVIVTTILFAIMHIPCALLDYENDLAKVAIRFLEAGLAGFVFSDIYRRTKSVLSTIAIHGLNKFFVTGLLPLITGISVQQVITRQSTFQLVWLAGQVVLVLYLSNVLFQERF